MAEKYRLIKDLNNEETWEFEKGNTVLKKGIICDVQNWDSVLTIMFDGKAYVIWTVKWQKIILSR